MNYVFGSMMRELEYKGVNATRSALERLEDISDTLVGFESSSEMITDIDYDIEPGVCKIYVICPELIIRSADDVAMYEAIEMADKFEFKQVVGDEEEKICLTLTVNI